LAAEGEYLLGMENGQWVYYYDGGQLKSVGRFNLGFEDGIWGLFYDNKQLTQEEFWDNGRLLNVSDYNTLDGKETRDRGTLKGGKGTRITYYVTGQKESEGSYQGGKSEGLWMYYHESGRKASEGMMKDGKKQGPWKFYNTAGRLEDLLQFKDDEIQYPKGSTEN
jgi:antitoxin component YwqK of YwqJK toxin-antitoxin module